MVEKGDKKIQIWWRDGACRRAEALRAGRDAYAENQDYSYPQHQHGTLPNRWCVREAGDRVCSYVGWRSRPRTVSELIHPYVATVLSNGRGHLKFGGEFMAFSCCPSVLLLLLTAFPLSFPPIFMQQYSLPVFTEHTQLGWMLCWPSANQIIYFQSFFFSQIGFSTG